MTDQPKSRSPRFKFTAKRLEGLMPPSFQVKEGGRQSVQQRYYWQGDGLGFCLSSTGTRSWVFVYRCMDRGKRRLRRDVLGYFSVTERKDGKHLTLREANAKADQYRKCLQDGKDPRKLEEAEQQDRRAADANTFLACAERFLTLYRPKKKPHLRPATLREYRRHLLVDFKPLHDQPLSSITKRDVNRALDTLQDRIKGVGINRCLATMRKMFHWAMDRGEIDLPPTAGVSGRAPEVARKRHLFGNPERSEPCEVGLLWNAADSIGSAGALPKLLLLTGQRRTEVAKMTWDELIDIDGENPRWIVPEDRAKNWRENIVPLGRLAVEVIRALPRVSGCRYVLTSDGANPRSGFSDLKETLDAAVKKIKDESPERYLGHLDQKWCFHDLRRTAKTGMAALGISGEIRDALFNHSPAQRMDQVYVHATYSMAKREAINKWSSFIEQHISISSGSLCR